MIENLLKTPKYWLTLEDCEKLLEDFRETLEKEEPLPPFKSRYEGKLEGILYSVSQTYDEAFLNATVLEAASSYFNQLIRGHSFKNGNKRLAVLYTLYFLLLNGVKFTLTPKEMYNFAVTIAKAGEKNINSEETKEFCKYIISRFTEETVIF